MPSQPLTEPVSDDDARWLMIQAAASLGRLAFRLDDVWMEPKPGKPWMALDVQTGEPWLDAVAPNTSLSGVIRAVRVAQQLLLADALSPRPLDRRRACLIVHHVSCCGTHWSQATLRLAERLGVQLAGSVMQETNGASLHNALRYEREVSPAT